MVGEEESVAGHSQKRVRQDAAHSRRDADAPPGIANREGGWSDQGHRKRPGCLRWNGIDASSCVTRKGLAISRDFMRIAAATSTRSTT